MRYFVSYAKTTHERLGFGWRLVETDTPVNTVEDIHELDEHINDAERASDPSVVAVVILSFQRLDD